MAKVFLICGKIASGKTYYSKQLIEKNHGILLSCDEILAMLFHHDTGNHHDLIVQDIKRYLHKKAIELVQADCNVILDWGFWTRKERREVVALYHEKGIEMQWHYIDLSDEQWQQNIAARNSAVLEKETDDYFVDEGLIEKFNDLFEVPDETEIDVWYHKIGYEEWDQDDFSIPAKYQLNENSKLHEALNAFYSAGGYDFFNVIQPEKYAMNWLDYMSELYNNIVNGKYQSDGKKHSMPLSDVKRQSLVKQGVPEVFTSDM